MATDGYTLYYFPLSYYSQKVLLALHEKKVRFKTVFISLNGEQSEPWYLKINPKGLVPVLQHGDRFIDESEKIIDYIDRHVGSEPCLVPDVSTAHGQEVETFRKFLDDIPIEFITYGTFFNPHLSVNGLRLPSFVKGKIKSESLKNQLEVTIKQYHELEQSRPELREEYKVKREATQNRLDVAMDTDKVKALLDDLENVFDHLEERLQVSSQGGRPNFMLLGSEYTAADLTATTFILRLDMLGLTARYMSRDKRPLCFQYADRLKQRAAVKKMQATANNVPYIFFKRAVKLALPTVLKAGTAVAIAGIAAYAFKKYDVTNYLRNGDITGLFKMGKA